jgi:hypothetical protein
LANPFFDWVASASRFVDFDVPTAADLNAPLDEVTAGFDAVDVRIDAIDTDLAGLISPVQTQLDAKADTTGETYTGAHNFTGATLTAATQASSDASTKVATTAFVDAIAFTTATGLTAASQAEMEAGTEAGMRAMSPLRVAQAIAAQTDMVYEARSSNTVFAAADKDKFIEYTGSFTQTFGSAASLGNGWKVVLKNAYTDSVYLTPSGGATIDGVTDFLMYPGEARLLQCDGTNFHSVVLQPFQATFTASGNFFKPPGYKYFGGLAWSGGASGSKSTGGALAASGGGGGGCHQFTLPASVLGASETVTIGAGGAAVTTATTAGNAGGATSLGSFISVTGGGAPAAYQKGGNGGSASSAAASDAGGFGGGLGCFAPTTGPGGAGFFGGGGGGGGESDASGPGGASTYGGGAGGAATTSFAAAGGASVFGGAGGAGVIAGAGGVAGAVPGGGGGGTQTGTASGAGAAGKLIVWGIV